MNRDKKKKNKMLDEYCSKIIIVFYTNFFLDTRNAIKHLERYENRRKKNYRYM